jgi:hypothetical protein
MRRGKRRPRRCGKCSRDCPAPRGRAGAPPTTGPQPGCAARRRRDWMRSAPGQSPVGECRKRVCARTVRVRARGARRACKRARCCSARACVAALCVARARCRQRAVRASAAAATHASERRCARLRARRRHRRRCSQHANAPRGLPGRPPAHARRGSAWPHHVRRVYDETAAAPNPRSQRAGGGARTLQQARGAQPRGAAAHLHRTRRPRSGTRMAPRRQR